METKHLHRPKKLNKSRRGHFKFPVLEIQINLKCPGLEINSKFGKSRKQNSFHELLNNHFALHSGFALTPQHLVLL